MPKTHTHEALLYHHRDGRPGKISVTPTKPMRTQRDLSMAYTPGVALAVEAIDRDPEMAYRYTAKGNLVAVITNGTAILGLGNRGPLAAKPVMEGKAVLFKRFADIDVFDLEVAETDPRKFVEMVAALAPTFGGINLEDIKAPECFYIEEQLKARLDIPVFHDDQHGTAIITGAALLNALLVADKAIEHVRLVVSGAGAAACNCAAMAVHLGVRRQNVMLVDSRGVIHTHRQDTLSPQKQAWAIDTPARTLADAIAGADVFFGLSTGGVLSAEMVRTMAPRPIIFAMANPDPEIAYPIARASRPDAIVATGRSDFPNQVNNVLGFPFIFRGALDVRATTINDAMQLAAVHALATLARQRVPQYICNAYDGQPIRFGPDYLIPKPLDPRVLLWVAPAVAEAAVTSGVARAALDHDAYFTQLLSRLPDDVRPHAAADCHCCELVGVAE